MPKKYTEMEGMNSDAGEMGEEDPGAVDNRLSIDTNDSRWSKVVADWEDGNEYRVSLRIRQMSPGEFEIIELKGPGSAGRTSPAHGREEAPKTAEAAKDRATRGITNPAVIGLLGKNR